MPRRKSTIQKVRFFGSEEYKKHQDAIAQEIVKKRLLELMILTVILVFILIFRLAYIQLTQSEQLQVKLDIYGSETYSNDAPRGEIYDRTYKKLVGNQNVICVNYYASKSITSEEITTIAQFLSKNINIDIESRNINNITTRNLKDYFMIDHSELAETLLTAKDLKEIEEAENPVNAKYNKCIERLSREFVLKHMTKNEIEQTRFEYLMKRCKSGYVCLVEGVSVKEASIIGENKHLLKGITISSGWSRQSMIDNKMSSILGKVTTKIQGLPATTKTELVAKGYDNNSRIGVSGLEQQYEDVLKATDSYYRVKYNANGDPVILDNINGEKGDDIRISIDYEIQSFADDLIEKELKSCNNSNKYFNQMYFILMKPKTGEVIAMSSKQIDKETGDVSDYSAGCYLDAVRVGSTAKAGTLYTAFKENIIVPNTYMMDEPIYIKGSNPKKSHRTMGNINEVDAMAYSSNVYMFRIAMKLGGANYVPHGPLNIDYDNFVRSLTTLRKCFGELGLGATTGLDIPKEGDGYKGNNTTAGLLLDYCIGQYDTYTPIQLAQYTCTLANGGIKVRPHFLVETFRDDNTGNKKTTNYYDTVIVDDLTDQSVAFERIKMGMRECVTRSNGTSHSFWSSKPYVAYCKTGTAEHYDVGDTKHDYPNHLQIGYIAADEESEPELAFVSIAYRQTRSSLGTSSSAPIIAHQVVDKYVEKYGLN